MKQYRVGLIRVLTTTDEPLLQSHGALLRQYFPMLDVHSRCLPDQPEGIHDEATMAVGVPKVVALAREMWEEGFEAVIVSCAGDPGVEQARRELPIPVIGAGESTAALSLFYGKTPALLGITSDVPDGYRRILGGRIVSNARGGRRRKCPGPDDAGGILRHRRSGASAKEVGGGSDRFELYWDVNASNRTGAGKGHWVTCLGSGSVRGHGDLF